MESLARRKKFNWGSGYLELMVLAAPIIFANFLQNFYNLADSYYMGKVGDVELATSSFTSPITQMIVGFGSGFAVGGGIIISRLVGVGDKREILKVNSQLISINMIFSFILMVLSLIFCESILIFSGASGELLEKSKIYMNLIFLTIPFTFLITSYTTIKNSKGKTAYPLILVGISTILNIVLNSLFIYKFNMGIKGIGIATLIANIILGFYCIGDLYINREFSIKNIKVEKDLFFRITKLGIPSSFTSVANSLSFIIINIFVVKYGSDVLAAYGIGNRINNIIYVIINGIGTALGILIGQNIGAHKVRKARDFLYSAMNIGILIGILSIGIVYFYLDELVGVFTESTIIKKHSINYLKVMLISVAPWAIFQALAGAFQGTGHTKFNMYCHFGRIWIFRVPLIILLEVIFLAEEYSIWYSMLLSNLFALLFSFLLYKKINWRKKI